MKEAPASMLFALFDAVTAIEGSYLAVFERDHPTAPLAFRMWCEQYNRQPAEEDRTERSEMSGTRNLRVHVLRWGGISVHFDHSKERNAA